MTESFQVGDRWLKPNYHAHIVFDWMNHETGKSRKLNDDDMMQMQTLASDILLMERGQSKAVTGKKHLERNDFIIEKQKTELQRMENFCAILGFTKEMTENLIVIKEALKCCGKIYSEQHRRNFNIKDDILMIENASDDESRLSLTINRKPIADWFREQWHRLRYGTRLSQQEEKKSRGIKM